MKQFSTYAGWIALVAVIVLYGLYFSRDNRSVSSVRSSASAKGGDSFRIAYFNIDTLQEYYKEFKDAEGKMKEKETASKNMLSAMGTRYQKRLAEVQNKARNNALSEVEGQAAQQELGKMENEYRQKDMELDQELKTMQMDLMGNLNKKVEDYLKEYNKDKGYAYIFSFQPGLIMYYKDSAYDVTREIIDGLNARYKPSGK